MKMYGFQDFQLMCVLILKYFRSLLHIQNLGLSKSTLKILLGIIPVINSFLMLSCDTVTFALKWSVINVKFTSAYMDATCSNLEVQMQWNKELFGKVITS